jgi:5-methylcytosine-specific restriction endonuclease McrA
MPTRKKPATAEERARIVADIKRRAAERGEGYRDRALKLLPHVCGRCGKPFAGKDLRLLTVHHKDHNHLNNPADGSNWELLCRWCHDDEHQKSASSGYHTAASRDVHDDAPLEHHPFESLREPDESK